MSKSTVSNYVLCSHWLHSNVNVGTNNLKMKSKHEQTQMSMSKNTVHDYEGCSLWLHFNVNVGTNNLKMKSEHEPTRMSMSKNTVHDYEGCSLWLHFNVNVGTTNMNMKSWYRQEHQKVQSPATRITGIVAAKEVGDTRLGSGDEISGQYRRSWWGLWGG